MRLIIFFLTITLSSAALATTDGHTAYPIAYSITKLVINRKAADNAAVVVATDDSEPATALPTQLMLDAEVKDALNFYRQDGWINLTEMRANHTVLLVFEQLSQDPILPASNYAPIDILMVDEQGKITEIVPSLILSSLEKEIYPQKPVKAFMLLASGSAAQLGIKPGDEVEYSIFKKPPPVITESSPAEAIIPEIPARAVTKIPDGNVVPTKPNLKERRTPEMQPSKPSKPQ